MQIFHSIKEWQAVRHKVPNHLSVGFVATMGNLHLGHASLFSASACENDITVASIFVNRTQFNQHDDFVNYPRTLDKDLELLKNNNVDYCIIPNEQDIYIDNYHYQVQANNTCNVLEGEFRPGHFTGVLTIVMRLLNIVKPDRCYFGEKDYQQYQLIRDMIEAFFMDIKAIPCPTIREPSGLALSSRNTRLDSKQKILANKFASIFHSSTTCDVIIQKLNDLGIEVEYIEDYNNRRYAAVKIGDVRLIDNIEI
ncbi:MAG: pantoate--beta-alanine ligase [Legionellaceae bacterium]|nr:pantoate--beta-alanine ligase [Legionellaceae bacterium]